MRLPILFCFSHLVLNSKRIPIWLRFRRIVAFRTTAVFCYDAVQVWHSQHRLRVRPALLFLYAWLTLHVRRLPVSCRLGPASKIPAHGLVKRHATAAHLSPLHFVLCVSHSPHLPTTNRTYCVVTRPSDPDSFCFYCFLALPSTTASMSRFLPRVSPPTSAYTHYQRPHHASLLTTTICLTIASWSRPSRTVP